MADIITPQISDRICKHMNEDHAEAIVVYAQAYGNVANAIAAQMVSIDPQGMTLSVQTDSETQPLRIAFDHELQDSEDAHQTLITMVRSARQKTAESSAE
jgi:putative heme iron utilization protein